MKFDDKLYLGLDKCIHICDFCYNENTEKCNDTEIIIKDYCKCCGNLHRCIEFEPNCDYFEELERKEENNV